MNLISPDLNHYFTKDLTGIIIGYVGNPEKKKYSVCLLCNRIDSLSTVDELCASFKLVDEQNLIGLKTPFRKSSYCKICYPYYLETKLRKKNYKSKPMRNNYQEICFFSSEKIIF